MADIILQNNDNDIKQALDKVIPYLLHGNSFADGMFMEIASGLIKTTGWKVPDNTIPSMSYGAGSQGVSKSLSRADHVHSTIIDDNSVTDPVRTWSTEKLTTKFGEKADATGGTGDLIDYTGSGCAIRSKAPVVNADVANKEYVDNASANLGACLFFGTPGTTMTVNNSKSPVNYTDSVVCGMTVDTLLDNRNINIPKTGKYLVSFDAIYTPSAQETITATVEGGSTGNTPIVGLITSNIVPNPVTGRVVSVSRIVSLTQGDKINLKVKTNTNSITLTHQSGGLTISWVGP